MINHPNKNLPQSFQLLYVLRGHKGVITEVLWSPDGKTLATSSSDSSIILWNGDNGRMERILEGHTGGAPRVIWAPDGQTLLSIGKDATIRLWDRVNGKQIKELSWTSSRIFSAAIAPNGRMLGLGTSEGSIYIWDWQWSQGRLTRKHRYKLQEHTGPVYNLCFSNDGELLASSSSDGTAGLWYVRDGILSQLLAAHSGAVLCVAFSPDRRIIATGSSDNTIRIWDLKMGRPTHILEGHTHPINSVSFSHRGYILASKSQDGTVRLWRGDTWEEIAAFSEPMSSISVIGSPSTMSFNPQKSQFAILFDSSITLGVWNYDPSSLIGELYGKRSSHYVNAKIVLLGDSGVGKSALGLVLSGQKYSPTESTHGRRVWTFESQDVEVSNDEAILLQELLFGDFAHFLARTHIEARETLLWDLAGQPSYRIIHQLHLDEVAVALVVFDARSETDPFSGVRHWDRALRQAQRLQGDSAPPLVKFLVAARTDRGSIPVSSERINSLVKDLEFDGYFETSAKEGWGIDILIRSIREAIDWQKLPKVSSTDLFQYIKEFLLSEKMSGRVLTTVEDLFLSFKRNIPLQYQVDNLRAQFETCIGRVEARGLIRRFRFGNLVLLQPELLDAYASSLVNAARDQPDGLGSISESAARNGKFRIPEDELVDNSEQRKLLLIAVVEDLLSREIALRETAEDETYLVFPSQLTRERPDLPEPEGRTLIFSFDGAVNNLYATLAVRLSHSGIFSKHNLWKNAATYSALRGGVCGMFMREIEEGRGEIVVFYDESTAAESKAQFESFIQVHLERRAVANSIRSRRIITCDRCGFVVSDQLIRIKKERKIDYLDCPGCGEVQISLQDRDEAGREFSSVIDMDKAADVQRDLSVSEILLHGKIETRDIDRGIMELIVIKKRRMVELEKKRAYQGMSTPPEIIMEIDDIKSEIDALQLKANNPSGIL